MILANINVRIIIQCHILHLFIFNLLKYLFCNYYQTYSFQNICKNYNSISYYSPFYIQFTKIYVFFNHYQSYSFQKITIKYKYLFFLFIFMLNLTKLTFAIIYLFFKYISIVDYFYLN